jgi:hypothetical protein
MMANAAVLLLQAVRRAGPFAANDVKADRRNLRRSEREQRTFRRVELAGPIDVIGPVGWEYLDQLRGNVALSMEFR